MKLKITILCENSVGRMIGSGEHGFSAFIESDQANYLFDTGNGHAIVSNSLALGKDLRSLKRIFLSHGHNDHTGGLVEVLKLKGPVEVHGHPDIFADRFSVSQQNGKEIRRFAGMIHKRTYLEFLGAHFVLNTEFTEIDPGVFLTGEVPRQTTFEKPDQRLKREADGNRVQDTLPDDQSLVLDTKKGLVVVLGCAHSGMINILRHIINKTQKDKFHLILGGTHLDFLTPEQREESIKLLKTMNIETIGVSHCTGLKAAARLGQAFGDRFTYGCVGSVFET
jgi:7,8-dihydropterin-6-yl-methyl-4-(beta-D-ribofuranosyl)aminobenzene 5'-phosphate synthase